MHHLPYENFVENYAEAAVTIPGCGDAYSAVEMVMIREHFLASL